MAASENLTTRIHIALCIIFTKAGVSEFMHLLVIPDSDVPDLANALTLLDVKACMFSSFT